MDAFVVPLQLRHTFSFWATASGLILVAYRPTRRLGALLWMLVGYGGIGVAWERTCGCDLRRLTRPPRHAVTGVATHFPVAVAGHVLWHVTARAD